jgi:hypothetical protein
MIAAKVLGLFAEEGQQILRAGTARVASRNKDGIDTGQGLEDFSPFAECTVFWKLEKKDLLPSPKP